MKKTSISSRFYQWIWNADVTEFKTMCPYFWGYLFTILFLPLILPVRILMPLFKHLPMANLSGVASRLGESNAAQFVKRTSLAVANKTRFWNIVGKVFLSLLIGFVLCVIGYIAWTEPFIFLYIIVLIFALIGLVVSIVFLAETTKFFGIMFSPFRFLGIMIYSIYNDLCPLIKWE